MRTARFRAARPAIIALALLLACTAPAHPSDKNKGARTSGTLTNGMYRPFLINNIFNYYGNNGDGTYNPFSSDNEGFEFSRGSARHVVFEDGMLWGGKHKGRDTAKVGGSVYRHALQAGPLLSIGTAITDPVPANAADPRYHLYAVRPDVGPHVPFSVVEALLNADEVPFVNRYETVTAHDLYDRYIADWNAWPAADGAPFTDVDKNGAFDPAVDIPGQPGADQTLWYVANDMNNGLTQRLAGCPPIGLEVQRTIWGYRRGGTLGNTIFISTLLINKSGAPVDSMYIAQWSDPDLGDAGDDFVGCDTTLSMGFVYNGSARDATFGTAPPAAGFVFVQGPMVPGTPSDTALFLASRRPGFRNLRMSSFAAFMTGMQQFADPAQDTYGDLQWYHVMNGSVGLNGTPFIDLNTKGTTKFMLAGDPVLSTDGGAGWVDGQSGYFPSDRRMCMTTGPFTLAASDTQQVVVACLASQGTDRLSSLTALRSDVRAVQHVYAGLALGRRMPSMTCVVARDTAQAAVTFRIDARHDPVTVATVNLTTATDQPVASLLLADDGLHDDGAAADGIWGGTAHVPVQHTGLKGGAVFTLPGGETIAWDNAFDHVTTAPLSVSTFTVASDNLNNDGIANPGENVRFTYRLRNDAPWDLPKLVTTASPLAGNGHYAIGTLGSHAIFPAGYIADDPATYFSFDVPAAWQDSVYRAAIVTTDDSLNIWRDTLVFPVRPLPGAVYTSPLQHIAGNAYGSYAIRVADPTRLKDHLYVLHGVDSAAAIGTYTLKDSTTGVVVLEAHAPPDPLGHTSPLVDGFKVLKGTIEDNPGMRSWEVPQGVRRFSPVGGAVGMGLEGFSSTATPTAYDRALGTIGAAMHLQFGGIGTTVPFRGYHTVLLKLAAVDNVALWDPKAVPTDTNFSRAYRYLRAASSPAAKPSFAPWIISTGTGYPYQDYNYGVPFSAWDMDVDPPVRLAVGHLENNVTAGLVDGRYWPAPTTSDNTIAREFAFIFSAPYTNMPDPKLAVNLSNNATTPLMWVMTCARRAEVPWTGTDQFKIVASAFPTSADAWVFNPMIVAGVQRADLPASFALLQNYPNPFNPSTTIRYDLPAQSAVTITIYDVLGRAVRRLLHDVQPAGSHAVQWHADNDAGGRVASGVYFYRCTIDRSDHNGQFDQTMKMIVVK